MPQKDSSGAKRILVIDDDPDTVRIMRYVLRDAGYRVIYAHGGDEGMQKAKVERPDLVLTDLMMPKTSGVDVIKALHDDPETRGIPILAVTAHTPGTLGQRARLAGCVGFVTKPFSAVGLLQQIAHHLAAVPTLASGPPPESEIKAEGLRIRL